MRKGRGGESVWLYREETCGASIDGSVGFGDEFLLACSISYWLFGAVQLNNLDHSIWIQRCYVEGVFYNF